MNLRTIIVALLISLALGILFQQKFVQEPALNFIKQNIPWSISIFSYIKDSVISGSLIGLFLYLIFASIPVLPSPPAEAYIVFALSTGTNIFVILFLTTLFHVFLATIYYFLGILFGKKILESMLKREVKHIPFIDRFIVPVTFFAYLLPIPLPIPVTTVLVLLTGFYRTEFIRVVVAVGFGTLLRILGIIVLYYLYSPAIDPYLVSLKKLLEIG